MGIDGSMKNDSTEYGTHEGAKRPVERLVSLDDILKNIEFTRKTVTNSRHYTDAQKSAVSHVLGSLVMSEAQRNEKSELTALLCAVNGNDFNLPQAIIELFRAKMNQPYEYINPYGMQEILRAVDTYYHLDDYEVDEWVTDMFGA